jgi:signal transduction histidine kinase
MSEINYRAQSASSSPVRARVPGVPTTAAQRERFSILSFRSAWKGLAGRGIRRRLLLWGLSLFGVALLVVVIAGYSYMARQIRQDAAALQSELASVTAEQIRTFVRRKIERFSDNARALSLYPLGSKEQRLLLSLLVKNDSSFTHASIIDSRGIEVVKVSDRTVYFPSDLIDQSKSLKFIKALNGEHYISPVHTSVRAQPYVTLAIPLWGQSQNVIGVVSAEADLSFLWEAIGNIRFATAGYAYLVEGNGNLIAHKDAGLVLSRMNLREVDGVKKFLRNPRRSDPAPGSEGMGLTGGAVLVTYAPIPDLSWSVILEQPLEDALAKVKILKRSLLAFLVVGLVLGAVIIAWVSQKITKPIQELGRDVARIADGDLNHRASIKTGDELEDLAAEFNKMTDALRTSYSTLEHKVEQRTKEVSALYTVTTAVNGSLELRDILNAVIQKIADIFGFESIRVFLFNDEDKQLELQASFAIDPTRATPVRSIKRGQGIVGRVTETGEPMIFEDVNADPRYAKLSTTAAAVNAGLGFFAAFPIKTQARVFGVILFSGRSSRKLSEDEIRLLTSMSQHLAVAVEKANLFRDSEKRAKQLDEANRAKSEFISAMSHELRTPLNVIMGNAELMGEGFWGEINADQKKSVRQIQHHSSFLLKLLNNVLALSRLDAKKVSLDLGTVRLDEIVAHVQEYIEQLNRTKNLEVSWIIDPDLPEIVTDETKLEEILQNLISNAFKFTPRGSINLHIKNLRERERVAFRISDTGIGIEESDMERIFGAFEQIREAHTGEFNGVGLGLNIVKKYLDLMRGEIQVQSTPGKGATFTFFVPYSITTPSTHAVGET